MQKQTKDKLKKAVPLALGSSMMVLSMLPAAAAFAASNNYITNVTTTANGTSVMASSTTNPKGLHVWYQFRAWTPSGHEWILRRFEASPTFNWTPPQSGTYKVEAFALTQYQVATKQWSKAVAGTTVTDTSVTVAKVAISASPSGEVGTGSVVTLTAMPEGATGSMVSGITAQPTWTVTTSSGATTSGATVEALASGDQAIFEATTEGSYTVTATLDGVTGTISETAYGQASAVMVSPASASVVADEMSSDTAKVTVTDAAGDPVANFTGSVTLTASGGLSFTSGSTASTTTTVSVTNGMASVSVYGDAVGTGTITASDLTTSQSTSTTITYGSATITAVTPVVTALQVSPATQTELAAVGQSATVTINALDQAGNVIPSSYANGFDMVTVTVSSPGSLNDSATSPQMSETVYVSAGFPASVTVYDASGTSGVITVTAAASGLVGGIGTIAAEPYGLPSQIGLTSGTTGTLSATTTATISGTSSSITETSGTTYTQYTVTLEDSSGTPVPAPQKESFTVTTNAATGDAYLFTSTTSTGAPTGDAYAIPSAATSTVAVAIASGSTSATFDVMNTTTQSAPAVISLASESGDYAVASPAIALTTSAQAPYTFVTGPADMATLTGSTLVLDNNQTPTYTYQVTDVNGNPVSATGTVSVTLTAGSTDATFANGATTETLTLTNGSATIAVDAGTQPGSYTIAATGTTGDYSAMITTTVEDLAAYVTSISVTNVSTGSVSGVTLNGLGSATFTLAEDNGVDQAVSATDTLQVTVSSGSTLVLDTSSGVVSGTTLSLPASAFTGTGDTTTFTVIGGSAGSATVTISDTSNSSVKSVTIPVTVQGLTSTAVSAAGETGTGNVAGTTATVMVNGSAVTAHYASVVSDFGSYDAATGELTVFTPTITTGTVGSTSESFAVWDIAGSYYYLALDETPGLGSTAGAEYVGISVTTPYTGSGASVQMAIGSGAYDGNSSTTDYAYVEVAQETTTGSFNVAPAQSYVVNTQVSLPTPGPSIVYPIMVQQP